MGFNKLIRNAFRDDDINACCEICSRVERPLYIFLRRCRRALHSDDAIVIEWMITKCGVDVNSISLVYAIEIELELDVVMTLIRCGIDVHASYTRNVHYIPTTPLQVLPGYLPIHHMMTVAWALLERGARVTGDEHPEILAMHEQRQRARQAATALLAIGGSHRDVLGLIARQVWHTRNRTEWHPRGTRLTTWMKEWGIPIIQDMAVLWESLLVTLVIGVAVSLIINR